MADPKAVSISLRDIIIIRLINALSLATFFQPDEFFQVLEPAWQLAFGPQSGAWLTWEWHHQLRSSLHPLLFSGAYLAADFLSTILPPGSPLRTTAIIAAPRILQAVIAALGDWFTFKLATLIYGPNNIPFFALLLQLFSPWQWYCSTRTFSNSLETTLTVTALHYYPWQLLTTPPPIKDKPAPDAIPSVRSLRISLCLAALAIVLRPTNILLWATIALVTLTRLTLRDSTAFILLREALLCGSFILGVSLLADRAYFGFWTFPPYNWLNFNISKSLAVFYGRNPWHYYILQGVPLLCTTSLPFAVPSLFKPAAETAGANTLKTLSYTVIVTITALSLISHKEVRFISPLLPILNILAAPRALSFFVSATPQGRSQPISGSARLRNKPLLCAALALNLLLASYLSFFHQPAPLTVLSFLRTRYQSLHPEAVRLAHATHYRSPTLPEQQQQQQQQQQDLFALFLMPCHSTPWRSHLVYPALSARALTCDPPLHTQPNTPERAGYRDEADRFYDDPLLFLRTELFPTSQRLRPRYIIGFEGIQPWLDDFMLTPEGRASGFKLQPVWSGFNGFVNEDWRRAGRMVVWDTQCDGGKSI